MTKRTSLFFIITVPFGTFPSISFIHITVFFHAIHFYNQQYQRSTIICLHVQVNRKYFLKYFKRTVLVLNRLCHVESFSIIHLRYQKDRIRQRKPTLSEIFQLQTPICHLSFKEPWIYQSFRQHKRRNAHKVSLAVA